MRGTSCWLALALWGVACGTQPAGPRRLESTERPIINGVPDTDPAHMAVVAISDGRVLCSATLIAPRVILTAAHCVHDRDIDEYEAFFGNSGREAVRRPVASGWVHPGYDGSALADDIALLRLGAPAPDGVEPIPALPPELALTQADEGLRVQFVGFGRTEVGDIADKLTVFGELDWVCASGEICGGEGFPIRPKTICFDESEGGACFGDSGGPNLIIHDDREHVAGVNSYVAGQAFCYDFACSTKVDEFGDWIADFMAADGALGEACSADRECLWGFCADGVCCDYACDAPCEACDLPGSVGRCTRVTDGAVEPGCGTDSGCATAAGAAAASGARAGLAGVLGALLLGLAVQLGRRRR